MVAGALTVLSVVCWGDIGGPGKQFGVDGPVIAFRVRGKGVVGTRLCPRVTPGAMGGFLDLMGGNCCSNLAFRHMVCNFVVRNNYPRNANVNNPKCSVGNRFTIGNFRGGLGRARNILSVTHSVVPSSTNSRFFVVRGGTPRLSNRCTTFNGMVRNVSIIGRVTRYSASCSSGPLSPRVVTGIATRAFNISCPRPRGY